MNLWNDKKNNLEKQIAQSLYRTVMMKSILHSFHFQAKRQLDSNKSVFDQENSIAETEGLKLINQKPINRTTSSDKTLSLSSRDLNVSFQTNLKQEWPKTSAGYNVKQLRGCHGNGDNYHPDFSKVQRKQNCEIRSFHNTKNNPNDIDIPLTFGKHSHSMLEGLRKYPTQFVRNSDTRFTATSTLNSSNSDKLKIKETELPILVPTRSSGKGGKTNINKSKLKKSLGLMKFMIKIKKATFSKNKRIHPKYKKLAANIFTLEDQKCSEIVASPIHQVSLANRGNSILYNTIHSERLNRVPPSSPLCLYKEKLSTSGLNVVSEFITPIAAADSYKATSTISPRKDVTTVVFSWQGSGHCKSRLTQSHDNRHDDTANCITAAGTAEEITGCTHSASVIYPKLGYDISSTAVAIPSVVSTRLATGSEINYFPSISTDNSSENFPNNKSPIVPFDRPTETSDTYVIAANPCQPKTNNGVVGGDIRGTDQSKDCLCNRLEDQSYELSLGLSCQTTCFANQTVEKSLLDDITFKEELSNKTLYQSPQHTLLTSLSGFRKSVGPEYLIKTGAVSGQVNKVDWEETTATVDRSLNDCCVNCVPPEKGVSLDHTQINEQRLVASTRNVDSKNNFCKRAVIDNFNNNCVTSQHFLCSNYCCHQLKTTRLKDTACQSSQYTDNLPDSCDDDNATEAALHRDRHVTKGIPGTCHATSALTGEGGERITERKKGGIKANYILGTQVQGNGIDYISTTHVNCSSFSNNNRPGTTSLPDSVSIKYIEAVGDENSLFYPQSHVITPTSNTNFDFQFNNSQYLTDTLSSSTWNKYQSSDNKSKSDSYDIITSSDDSPVTRHHIDTKLFVDNTNPNNEFSFSSLTTTHNQTEHDVLPTKEQKCHEYPWPITDHTAFHFGVDNDIGGGLSAARAVREQLGKQFNPTWLDPLLGFSHTKCIDNNNCNVISNKCDENVTTRSLIPTKSTPLSHLSSLSAAGVESTPVSLLSSFPSIVFTPEILVHSAPTIETCVRKDSEIISSNSFSYSPTSVVATSLGNATQTTLVPSCFLLTSSNVAITSTHVSDTFLLREHVKEAKKRKGRRSDSGKDKFNKARTNKKKNAFDREAITTAQQEGHTWSNGLFGNKQLSLFTQEETCKNSFTEKLKDSNFFIAENPRNPYHHHINYLCVNEAKAGYNQQVSSRCNYCGTENTVNHFGLLSSDSATKGPPCIETTYCCTPNYHYYTNSGTYRSNITTTTTDSTIVAETTCIKVSKSERSRKSSDSFDCEKETCRVSTNQTTDCVVCTLGYRGNELSNAATTTTTTTPTVVEVKHAHTDHISVVCSDTVLKDGSLPLFIHADSLLHRKYSGNRSSSSSGLLTQQAVVHSHHPTYTAIRSLLPIYSSYVGTASSNCGDGEGGERHIADTGTAEFALLELKTKPANTVPLYLPPKTKHFLYGKSDCLCCLYKCYSDKHKKLQKFSNKSTNYRCITATLPSAQFVLKEAESLQRQCACDTFGNVVLSSIDVCGDIESDSETRIKFNEDTNMDSTKIINNQTADGFHNSAVYRKCDRITGEGSGEIILSSDYGGVSTGNRVEMKKSSSPCKIPVQQKQKTNMNPGTKHSVKSSQLPRGKSTLVDQTTKISLNKQTTQHTSADSSRLPSKCTGKKSSVVNGDTNVVKKQGDKNIANLKNINVGKSVSSSKIHRNTALSKTKHQTPNDISSKNCNELISVDKHISTVLSEESPEDSESAIDEVKVVNELNDKFRLRSDSESSHASHSSFCSQLSTSSVKSSICLPSSTKSGLGKTSKILTSSCSRLAVSKTETKLQKQPSMLSRTTSSTTVSRISNSTVSHPSKSSPAHTRLTSRVNTENLQRAVSTGSLRNNSNKLSIPPTGRPNTTVTKSSGLSLRQKKVADSASDLSVNRTTRLGSKIQTKESLKTVSSENLSNKIQNSFGKSCENLSKKKKNMLQASCENLSIKSRNNCVSTSSDSTLQQRSISHNKKLTSTQSISNGGLVHQKEKYSGGISLLKASRLSGSSSSSIPTAVTAADKLDNKKLGNVRSSTSAITERRAAAGFSTSSQECKPTTNIDRTQIRKSVPTTGRKTTSLKSNEAIEPLSKRKPVTKTGRHFSDHKVTSNLPTASSGMKKTKLLDGQSNKGISQTAGKNFQRKATYDSNRLQLDKTKNMLSVNEVENSELRYKELDDTPENEDKVDKDRSSTKPNISENFAYDDYMIITEALSDESISGPSVHVGDLDNVSNHNHLSDIDASESCQTSSSASALDISLHEDYVYSGSLVTSSSDSCTDKYTGFRHTQSVVHACREVTSSYQPTTSEDECSEKEEKEETERNEEIEENRVIPKLSDHGVIKSDVFSDKTFDYEASYDCNLSSCGYQQSQKHYGQPHPHQQYPHHSPQQYPHHPPQHHYHPPHQSTGTEDSFKSLSTDSGRGAQSGPQLHSINDSKCVYNLEFEQGQNQKQEEDGEEKAVGESEKLEEKASVVVFKSADIYRVAGHGMPVVEFTPPQIARHNILRNESSGSGGCNPVSATDRTSKDVTATKTTTVLRGEVDTEGEFTGAERSDEEATNCPVNKLLQRERDRPTSFTQVNVGEEALFKQQISFGEVAVTTTTTIKADVTNSSLQEMADPLGIQSSKLQLGDLHTSQTSTQTYDRDVICEKCDLSRSSTTLFMEQQQQLDSNATRQMTGPFLPSEMGFLAGQMLSPCSNDSSSFKDISDGAVTPLSDVQEIFDQETSQLNDISNVDELSDTCKLVSDSADGEAEGVLIEIEDSTLQVSGSPDGEDEIIVEEQDYVVTDERNYDEEATHFTNDDIMGERPIVDAGEDLAEVTLDSNETQNLWFSIEAETDSQYENLSTSITLENIAESSIGEDVEELLDQSPSIESCNNSRVHGHLRGSILRQLQTQMSEDDAPDILSDEVPSNLDHIHLRTRSVEADFDNSDQQLISGCHEKRINKDSYLHSHQLEPCFHTDSLAENIQHRSADVKLDNFKSQTKNSLSENTVLDDNLLETDVNSNDEVQRTHTNSFNYGYKKEFDSLDINICNYDDISQEMELEDGGFIILRNDGAKKTNDSSNQDFTLRQLQGTLNLRKQKILELCGQTESVSSKDLKSPSPTRISIDRKERSPSFKRLDAFCTIPRSVNENISPTRNNSSLALNIPKADTVQNLSPKSDEIVSPIKESWIKHEGKWKRGYILDDGSSIPSEKYQDYILKSTPVTPNSEGEHSFSEKYSCAEIVKDDSSEENSLILKQQQLGNLNVISKPPNCMTKLFNQSPVFEKEVWGNNENSSNFVESSLYCSFIKSPFEAESAHENSKMHKTVLGDITSTYGFHDSVDGHSSEMISTLTLDTISKMKDYGGTEMAKRKLEENKHISQAETAQPVIIEQKTYSPEIVDDIPFVDMDETLCNSNIVSIAPVKLKNNASQDLPEVSPMQESVSSMNIEFKNKERISTLDLQKNNLEQIPHPSMIEPTSYCEHESSDDLDTITDDPSIQSSVDELKCEPLIDSGFEPPLLEFDNISMTVSDIVTTNDADNGRLIDSGIAQPSDMDWVPITDEYDIILPANAEEDVSYLNCEPVNSNKRMQLDLDNVPPFNMEEVVNEISNREMIPGDQNIDPPRKLIDSELQPMDLLVEKMDLLQEKISGETTHLVNNLSNYHTSEETQSSLENKRDISKSEQDIYSSSPKEVGSLCDEIFSIIGSPTLLNRSWKKFSQNKSDNDLSKSENELYFDGKRAYRNIPTSRSVYANIIRSSIYENSESESSESLDSISKTSYDDLKQTKDKNNIKLKGQGYSSNEDSPDGLMSSMDFYLDASEFARACWSDRSTLSEFYQVGSHQKLRVGDSSAYGKGIYAVKAEDSQDIKLLAEISELDETCGENSHIISQAKHCENIQHNDNSLSRSETYWSPGSSPSMRKPYRRSLSLPFANHDGEGGRSILHCTKVDLEYPVTAAGFGTPPELPSKIGRSLRKHNTVRRFSTQRSLSSDCTKEKYLSTSAESHDCSTVLDDLSPSHHTVSFTPATEETACSDNSKTLIKRTTDRPASLDEVQLRAQFLDLRLKGYNASEVTTSNPNGKVSPSLSDHFNKPCLHDSETGIIIQHGDEINYLPPKSPGILRRMFRRGRSFSEKVKPIRPDEVMITPKDSLARKMSMKSIFRRSRSGSNSSQKSKEFDASDAGRLEDGSDDRMSKESFEKGSDPLGMPLTLMSDEGSHRSNFSSLSMISSVGSTPPTSPASFSCTLVGSDIPKDEVFEDDNTLSLAYDKNYNSKLLTFRKSCKQHQPRNSFVGKGGSESEATGAYSGSSSNSNAYFAASDLHSGSGSSFPHPAPMSAQEMDKLAAVARGEMVSSNSSDSGIQHDSSLQSSNESLKVYQWKMGKEKERKDGYDFKVVDVALGNEQIISENSHEVIHRKSSVSSRERPKSDINVHWPQHVEQVASYFDPRFHLREHQESTISRPRPKSDLGGSTLSSEAMKEFLQGKLPQSQSQKTISEMNRTSYLVTKARRMSTPHPIKSRIADRSALTKQKKILGRSHSMPENLNKIHKRRRIHPSGSDPLSDLLSQHSTNDDSSDESEVSMDYSLPDKCHSTRTSQLGLAPLDEIFETENLTYAEALWDHVTMDTDELAFRAGEVIKVTDMIDKDWWWGILEDKDGWFPANFVRLRANQDHHLEEAAKLEGADSSKDSSSNVGKTHQFNSNQARTNVINEIISAEREYVHQLDDVLQGYVVQAKKRPDMFPDDKISTIFGNLEDIYTFSKKFFKSLEVSLKDDLHQSEVGHCFIEHRKGFEIYSDYCNNHPHACDQLKELCKNKRYRHFFEGCRLLQDMKQIPLEGFLLTPVQKICKYPLQLAELLKYTSTSHPDYRDVCEALDAMKKIACLINERKRRMESIEKIAEWQSTVEDWEGPDLLETSSELIYSGELSKVNSSGWTQERYFFLFDHQLIYCRKDLLKKNSFSFRGRIYLDHSKIYPVVDGRDPQFNVYVKNGWKLHDNKRNKSFLVFSKNAVEKDRWLKAFDEERKKVKSDQENGFTIPPNLRKSCARNSFRSKTQPERPKEKLMKKNMPMSFRHQQELWKNLPAHATLPRGMTNPTTLLERLPHTSANKKRSWFSFAGKKKR